MSKITKSKVVQWSTLAFIAAEVLLFFFLPVASLDGQGFFAYVTMWDMLRHSAVFALPNFAFRSLVTAADIVPYLLFMTGIAVAFFAGDKFSVTVFSVICTVVSFILLCCSDTVYSSYIQGNEGFSASFDNESWVFVFLAFYLVAIVFLFYGYSKRKKPDGQAQTV